MGPTQLSRQCRDYCFILVSLGKPNHVAKALFRKPSTVYIREIACNEFDNFLAVNTSSGFENIITNPATNMPMEHNEFGIYPDCNTNTGRFNQRLKIFQ